MGCSFVRQDVVDAGERTGAAGPPAVRDDARVASRRAGPVPGDVLVSERSARADVYAISIFPSAAVVVVLARYADAIEKVREMARSLDVDGWYTCDHTHYAQVTTPRSVVRASRTASSCARG